jgi:hypothetical protein
MAKQTINIGNLVNDGLGDDLRTAFQKVNANFSDLYSSIDATGENIGAIGEGVFAQKSNNKLQFKKLVSGTKINLVGSTDNIIINSTQPEAFISVHTDNGIVSANTNTQLTIQGGGNITVTGSGSVVTVDTDLNLNGILKTWDFGTVTGDFDNTVQFLLAQANIDFGVIRFDPDTSQELVSSNIDLDLGSI